MKKGICIGSLPGDSLAAKFKLAKDMGFDGVEIGTLETSLERERNKATADTLGLELFSVMNQKHWSHPLSHPDAQVRQASVQGMIDSMETATVIGASTVLLVPAVVNEQATYEEAYARSQAVIRELIPKAAEKNLKISIENVWNKFLLSPIEFVRYIDEFDSDSVAAYFDVGNIVLYGFPQHWIRSLGSRIDKVHVKGFNAKERRFTYLIEDCTIDWNAVMTALSDVGYDDYITAELPTHRDDPYGTVRKISEDMDKIIAGAV
jgi:hexulose-6-phosphate isomerase